jgi:hypothetical protein
MLVIRRHIANDIQSNREFKVARIEIHQMVGTLGRNVVQQFFGQIAVGINQANTVSKGDVLQNQIAEQRRFAGPGFADDVEVLALVNGRYAKGLGFTPAMTFADCDAGLVVHGAKISRHPCHRKIRVAAGVTGGLPPAVVLGARLRDNGGWFWNPNGPSSYHLREKWTRQSARLFHGSA